MKPKENELIKEFKDRFSLQDQENIKRIMEHLFEGGDYDPTKFSISTGDDAVLDDLFSYQVYNKIKDHWRAATAPANIQAGMIWNDSDVNKFYGYDGTRSQELSTLLSPNLLSNSGFGVWSNSDTNKGLGSMIYDGGSGTVPAVGDVATGATSGTVAKVISYTTTGGAWGTNDAVGIITLGACASTGSGRFNDDEQVNFTSGGHCHVNHPDTGVGVDLIQNGEFYNNTDPPPGWTGSNATLTTEAGGQVGNCMRVLLTTNNGDGRTANIGVVAGKIYKLSFYYKNTAGDQAGFAVWNATGGTFINLGTPKTVLADNVAWTAYSFVFEAPDGCANVTIMLGGVLNTDIIFFDEVALYEIIPCCTAADTLAQDTWVKDTTLDIYREHWGTNTQDGSFYALKLVPTTASDFVYFPNSTVYDNEEWYAKWQGRIVTLGAYVKTSTASHAKLTITDSVGSSSSSYHTGGGTYEWLEVTKTIAAAATAVRFFIYADVLGVVGGGTIVYVSQPMLVFGSSIGAGNYAPIPQEIIWVENSITSNLFEGLLAQSDSSSYTTLNVEADSTGKVPKGAKSITIILCINDSGSATSPSMFYLRANANTAFNFIHEITGIANDQLNRKQGICPCDLSGDVQYYIEASGANTLDITVFRYQAVQIN